MTWICGPLWDGFFLLSGLPIGLMLVYAAAPVGLGFFTAAIVLETAHVLSPIVLVWTHAGLRRIAMKEWVKWLAVPLILLGGCFLVPMSWVFGLYWSWNIYHFGMQNFGVVSLYQRDRSADTRVRTWLVCVGLTTLGMGVLPVILHDNISMFLLFTGVFSFNHWLTDIGLCSRVSRRHWLFIGAMLALGTVGFVWLIPRTDHIATWYIPPIIIGRWGLGFVHFLYSRWLWKLSDPRMREIVGGALT
jgi:hypothetical protein